MNFRKHSFVLAVKVFGGGYAALFFLVKKTSLINGAVGWVGGGKKFTVVVFFGMKTRMS